VTIRHCAAGSQGVGVGLLHALRLASNKTRNVERGTRNSAPDLS